MDTRFLFCPGTIFPEVADGLPAILLCRFRIGEIVDFDCLQLHTISLIRRG